RIFLPVEHDMRIIRWRRKSPIKRPSRVAHEERTQARTSLAVRPIGWYGVIVGSRSKPLETVMSSRHSHLALLLSGALLLPSSTSTAAAAVRGAVLPAAAEEPALPGAPRPQAVLDLPPPAPQVKPLT